MPCSRDAGCSFSDRPGHRKPRIGPRRKGEKPSSQQVVLKNPKGSGLIFFFPDMTPRNLLPSKSGSELKEVGGFIFFFFKFSRPTWGKIPILTNIFQRHWNHQLVKEVLPFSAVFWVTSVGVEAFFIGGSGSSLLKKAFRKVKQGGKMKLRKLMKLSWMFRVEVWGWHPSHLCGGLFQKQPGFHGKSYSFFFSWLR